MTGSAFTPRIISLSIAAAVVLCGLLWQSHQRQRLLEQQLTYAYVRTMSEITAGLTAMCESISQLRYVENGPLLWTLSAQLLRESALTKQALLSLPLQDGQLEGAGRFLSQSGSFALAMSRSAVDNGALASEHRKALESLYVYGQDLRDAFAEAATLDAASEFYAAATFSPSSTPMLLDTQTDFSPDPQGVYAAFTDYDEEAADYPSLVYDGPFSDHLTKNTPPAVTAAKSSVTQAQASLIASRLTHIDQDELVFEGIQQSEMPVYAFRSPKCSLGITVKGGYLSYFRCYRDILGENLDAKTAKLRGDQFLESLGLFSMTLVYTRTDAGMRVLHYVPLTQDGVLCYPDVVKVGIAADNGAVLFYDGRNYLMNHTERNIPSNYLDEEQVLSQLSPLLMPESLNLAWLPTEGGAERFCWEIRCTATEQPQEEVWVYRNALTGLEEEIQLIR